MGGTEEEQRRSLRRKYNTLKNHVVDVKADLMKTGSGATKLCELIEATDRNFQAVSAPLEQVRDAEVLGALCEIGVEKAKGSSGQSVVSHAGFISRLRLNYAPGWNTERAPAHNVANFSWSRLGTDTAKFFATTPTFTCMLGPTAIQIKERKKREKREKQPLAKLVNPDEVVDAGEAKQQETDRNMKEMAKVMKQAKRVHMATLVNNPESFAQTVENIFTLSFLVKDGKLGLLEGTDGWEVVLPKGDQKGDQDKKEKSQFVHNFTLEDWREMQPFCGEPVLKNRVYTEDDGSGARAEAAETRRSSQPAADAQEAGARGAGVSRQALTENSLPDSTVAPAKKKRRS